MARDLGVEERMELVGERKDVLPDLLRATLFVLPSRSEGLSNALLEAMQAGLPCVATRVGGNPELVRHGVNGLIVPPDDEAALAGALDSLIREPERARRMGEAGRRLAREAFPVQAMVEEFADLYRDLWNRPGASA
jgi:glycosyltransferase involved in cell wall biosynthesis